MSDVDWPMCLERIEFDYINLATNVSKFKKEFKAPFKKRSEFDLEDRLIPCNDNFDYVTRVGTILFINDNNNVLIMMPGDW